MRGIGPSRDARRKFASVVARGVSPPPAPSCTIALVGVETGRAEHLRAAASRAGVAVVEVVDDRIPFDASAIVIEGVPPLATLQAARRQGDLRPALVASRYAAAAVSRVALAAGAFMVVGDIDAGVVVDLATRAEEHSLRDPRARGRWIADGLVPWITRELADCSVSPRVGEVVARHALGEARKHLPAAMSITLKAVDVHIGAAIKRTGQHALRDVSGPFRRVLSARFPLLSLAGD